MEVVEDDLFFADLSKRISLLIMDDDEDPPTLYSPPVSLQVLSQTMHPNHNQITSFHNQIGRKEIKGTGVFIPQSSTNPRSKQSRSKSSNTRNLQSQSQNQNQNQSQRHVSILSEHFPYEAYNNHNTNYTSYNSLYHKRCY